MVIKLVRKNNKWYLEPIRSFMIVVTLLSSATILGYFIRYVGFPETNIVIIYLLSILLTSRFTPGYGYGLQAAFYATLIFNYFFTAPYFSLSVDDPSYIITFIIMTVTAFITSALTSRVKQSAILATQKETETAALYHLTNRLSDAVDIESIVRIAIDAISNSLDCFAACLCFSDKGIPDATFLQQQMDGQQVRRSTSNIQEIKKKIEALHTACYEGEEFYDFPIYGRESILGIVRLPSDYAKEMKDANKKLLRSMIESIALAMDRYYSTQEKLESRNEAIQERYRSSLLRAISHDLRTPLTSILGSSEILIDMSVHYPEIKKFVNDIHKEADWLRALVENILNLTRLQDGKLLLDKEYESAEEVIGFSINNILRRYPEYKIHVEMDEDDIIIPMDARLIAQVFINLLDNAVKYSKDDKEISIRGWKDATDHEAHFVVADRGVGIKESELANIFQLFYTTKTKQVDGQHGIGLGLSICEAIIKAHGGTIVARNRGKMDGVEFELTLPMEA